jgi:kynurenine formamidase
LSTRPFVDLTHAFGPGIPHWKGFPDEKRETLYWYDASIPSHGTGFFAQSFTHVGQWGTHVDPPAHFIKGLRTVDQIDVREMVMPLVVFDVHEKVAANPDYTLTMDDVKAWEAKHGLVPERAFVAMRTDWSKRWPDADRMQNRDAQGVSHYPGWSRETLQYLYEQRRITASGHEPTDTDPGVNASKDDFSLEIYVLQQNHYQIEMLAIWIRCRRPAPLSWWPSETGRRERISGASVCDQINDGGRAVFHRRPRSWGLLTPSAMRRRLIAENQRAAACGKQPRPPYLIRDHLSSAHPRGFPNLASSSAGFTLMSVIVSVSS